MKLVITLVLNLTTCSDPTNNPVENEPEILPNITLVDVFIIYLYGDFYQKNLKIYNPGVVKSYRTLSVMLNNFCLQNKDCVINYYLKHYKKSK